VLISASSGEDPKHLDEDLDLMFKTNVTGNIHLFNLFLPLILKGEAKKVIFVSSGMSDLDFSTKLEIEVSPTYVISKAAANMAVAKFGAQYKKDGVLFISVCPGVIEPGDGIDFSTRMSPTLCKLQAVYLHGGLQSV
jgi:NAD(P)-dependent dehydrogenase (short-subunit alcohol dehydrogenase family)